MESIQEHRKTMEKPIRLHLLENRNLRETEQDQISLRQPCLYALPELFSYRSYQDQEGSPDYSLALLDWRDQRLSSQPSEP